MAVIFHVLLIRINYVGIGTTKTHVLIQYTSEQAAREGKVLNPVTNGNCGNILMTMRKYFKITGKKREGILTEQLEKQL